MAKRGVFVFGGILLIGASAFASGMRNDAAWVGVWHAELDGQPGVTLTLGDDMGDLGGTVVLNMVSREGGQPHVLASESHVLVHPRLDGDILSFQVKRRGISGDWAKFTLSLGADGKAQLHCLTCGAGAPVVELQRIRYR